MYTPGRRYSPVLPSSINWLQQLTATGDTARARDNKERRQNEMRLTKKTIYRLNGIEFDGKKLTAPDGMQLNELLKLGNTKIGKVWQFSSMPTAKAIKTRSYGIVNGTCPCTCEHCYGTCGNYCFPSVRDALARNTIVAREYLNWTMSALRAQLTFITKDGTKSVNVRIHVTGDFFSLDYATMWKILAIQFPCVNFWTYTKSVYGHVFDDVKNVNIVKSIIDGIGFNFGTIAYILDTYRYLVKAGKSVYVCPCGIENDETHCDTCTGCREHEYVLFVLHSTPDYKAVDDELYPVFKAFIDYQKTMSPEDLVAWLEA